MLSVAVSAFAAGVLIFFYFRAHEATLTERLRARDNQVSALMAEVESLRISSAVLASSNAQFATRLEAEHSAHERLINEFKALSADALRANRSDFLEQANQAFAHLHHQSISDLEQRKQAVESMVQPLRESLDKVDLKISEMEKARAGAYGALGEQLKALATSQLQLQLEAARLSTALRSTTYAGSWGELQLRRVVEMADMVSYCDFTEQEISGLLRADLVVKLPGGQRIVVDAKTPLESFRAAHESVDEGVRTARLIDHAARVKSHIDTLGAKNYWEQFQPAPEFVVLFLPGDHYLTAALQADNSLMDRALSRRVLLATPTTLIALLKAASYGWRQDTVSKNADEISSLGRSLYDRAATFADVFNKIGRSLEMAVKSYNMAVGSFESMLIPGTRKLGELGAKGAKDIKVPLVIETNARELSTHNYGLNSQ